MWIVLAFACKKFMHSINSNTMHFKSTSPGIRSLRVGSMASDAKLNSTGSDINTITLLSSSGASTKLSRLGCLNLVKFIASDFKTSYYC